MSGSSGGSKRLRTTPRNWVAAFICGLLLLLPCCCRAATFTVIKQTGTTPAAANTYCQNSGASLAYFETADEVQAAYDAMSSNGNYLVAASLSSSKYKWNYGPDVGGVVVSCTNVFGTLFVESSASYVDFKALPCAMGHPLV